MTHTTQELVLW